jgi:predicted nucleotidyltransferase
MVARYETGAAAPSVAALQRLLTAAGHELLVSSRAIRPHRQGALLDTLRKHRADIQAAAVAVGARDVRVFGSVARGNETSDSDVDLMVDFPVRTQGLLPLLAFADSVGALIGRRVDVATADLLAHDIHEQAIAEAIPL